MDPAELRDRFETTDGSRPEVTPLEAQVARRFPLSAFNLLQHGDAFESMGTKPPADGPARARQYVADRVQVLPHGAPPAAEAHVRSEIARQLSANPALASRLGEARPIAVDLVPAGKSMARFGYPSSVSRTAAGLFWDHPSWPKARIALLQDKLTQIPALVIHEMAHAIQALAFTGEERKALYAVLLRTYGSRAAADEVFAVYSEREFLPEFSDKDRQAPGVYGHARRRWSEEHVFTRFVRNLYFPHKPLAGPPIASGTGARF